MVPHTNTGVYCTSNSLNKEQFQGPQGFPLSLHHHYIIITTSLHHRVYNSVKALTSGK